MNNSILVVDDSANIRKIVKLTFEGIYEVLTAENGEIALETIKTATPDLILVDANMPGISGYEVCRTIKQENRFQYVPVILMIGTFDTYDEEQGKTAKYDLIISKPFESEFIIKTVTEEIEKAEQRMSKQEETVEEPQEEYIEAKKDEDIEWEDVDKKDEEFFLESSEPSHTEESEAASEFEEFEEESDDFDSEFQEAEASQASFTEDSQEKPEEHAFEPPAEEPDDQAVSPDLSAQPESPVQDKTTKETVQLPKDSAPFEEPDSSVPKEEMAIDEAEADEWLEEGQSSPDEQETEEYQTEEPPVSEQPANVSGAPDVSEAPGTETISPEPTEKEEIEELIEEPIKDRKDPMDALLNEIKTQKPKSKVAKKSETQITPEPLETSTDERPFETTPDIPQTQIAYQHTTDDLSEPQSEAELENIETSDRPEQEIESQTAKSGTIDEETASETESDINEISPSTDEPTTDVDEEVASETMDKIEDEPGGIDLPQNDIPAEFDGPSDPQSQTYDSSDNFDEERDVIDELPESETSFGEDTVTEDANEDLTPSFEDQDTGEPYSPEVDDMIPREEMEPVLPVEPVAESAQQSVEDYEQPADNEIITAEGSHQAILEDSSQTVQTSSSEESMEIDEPEPLPEPPVHSHEEPDVDVTQLESVPSESDMSDQSGFETEEEFQTETALSDIEDNDQAASEVEDVREDQEVDINNISEQTIDTICNRIIEKDIDILVKKIADNIYKRLVERLLIVIKDDLQNVLMKEE